VLRETHGDEKTYVDFGSWAALAPTEAVQPADLLKKSSARKMII